MIMNESEMIVQEAKLRRKDLVCSVGYFATRNRVL